MRLVNITPDDIFSVSLQAADGQVLWTAGDQGGAPLPAAARTPVPAHQTIAVVETYDLESDASPAEDRMDRGAQHRREVAGARGG